ncbi:MAG: hypothetical protein R3E83_01635 [Burkholderiaceae bacterium]
MILHRSAALLVSGLLLGAWDAHAASGPPAPVGMAPGVLAPVMTAQWNGQMQRPAINPVAARNGGALRVQRATIVDPSGFERAMNAVHLWVPSGLQPRGGVVWRTQANACPSGPVIDWMAESADRLWAVEVRPPIAWIRADTPAVPGTVCPVLPLDSVRSLLHAWVRNYRPNAQVLDYRRGRISKARREPLE